MSSDVRDRWSARRGPAHEGVVGSLAMCRPGSRPGGRRLRIGTHAAIAKAWLLLQIRQSGSQFAIFGLNLTLYWDGNTRRGGQIAVQHSTLLVQLGAAVSGAGAQVFV